MMVKKRLLSKFLFSIALVMLLVSNIGFVASFPVEGGVIPGTPFPTPLSVGSGAAEQDNVDSFDVNPKSGRWNVSKDVNTDDLVTDSQLRLTTVENATSSSSEYLMDRGLRKLDSKVEFRLSGDGGGNQTEFFRDVRGDALDFEEDIEGYVGFSGGIVSVSNGILKIEGASGSPVAGGRNFLPTNEPNDGGILTQFIIRMKANVSTSVAVGLHGVGIVFIDTTTVTTTFATYEFSITGQDNTWSQVRVSKNTVAENIAIFVDFIEVIGVLDFATHVKGQIEDTWDFEEADIEDWVGLTNRTNDGFGNLLMGGQGATPVIANVGNTILTSQFHLVVMNITALEGVNITIKGFKGSQLQLAAKTAVPADTSLTLTFDLSQDSDWTGTFEWVGFAIDDFATNETLWLDYFLLLGDWDPVDSTIGLFDTDSDSPLLNVSLHFTSNNSHPNDSQVSTIEVEIMDKDGEIAFNFTEVVQIHGLFLRGKITYDILESDLAIKLEFDNGTRIFRINLPIDFTSQSGRVPALFSLENTPSVFISTYTSSISWQTLRLDFVNAPYKEREWAQIDSPSDPNWLFQNWDGVRIEDDIATENSNWSLTVPFLDSISGTMRINVSDFGSLDFNDDVSMWLQVFGVDSNDGELHRIVKIRMTVENTPGKAAAALEILNKTQVHESNPDFVSGLTGVEFTPLADFSISLTKDRSILNLKLRFTINELDPTNFVDTSINYTISDIVDDPSQEFIIRTGYVIQEFSGDTEAVLGFLDFGFLERDIFSDIVKAIVDPIGNFLSGIFAIAFRFLATIFQIVGDLIIFAFEVAIVALQTALTAAIVLVEAAIGTLQTALEAALTALGVLLEAAIEALEPFLTLITDAVEALWTLFINTLSDIVDELITLASSFVDFFFDVLELLIPLLIIFLLTIVSSLIDLLAGLLFFLWDALSLPNLLALLDVALVAVVDFISWAVTTVVSLVTLLDDLGTLILVGWWTFAVFGSFAREQFEPGAGLSRFMDEWVRDLNPVDILGIHIPAPAGAIFTLWLIFLLPVDFAIFQIF